MTQITYVLPSHNIQSAHQKSAEGLLIVIPKQMERYGLVASKEKVEK